MRFGHPDVFVGLAKRYMYTVYDRLLSDFPAKRTVYAHRIHMVLANPVFIRCMYGLFGREITKYTVIYGVHIRFWPTLCMCDFCGGSRSTHTHTPLASVHCTDLSGCSVSIPSTFINMPVSHE
jgi:hypothetical protein